MAVDGVNNSNRNAGLYAAGTAVAGAGAGVAAAYLTKPFLKDGAPTDTFKKKIEENVMETLDPEIKKSYQEELNKFKALENAKNAEELKEVFRNDETLKEFGLLDATLADIDAKGFEAVKKDAMENVKFVKEARDEMIKTTFDASWDKSAKKFVYNADEITKEAFKAVKKAAKSIQGKYASIYGSIGAGVLGLTTYLCLAGKKEPQIQEPPKEQPTDKES